MPCDLSTAYLGLRLPSPIVASAGPLTGDVGSLLRLEAAGAGAVVLPSLFEEEIVAESFALDQLYRQGADSFVEAQSFHAELDTGAIGPRRHLDLVAAATAQLTIPVIASLNGTTASGWIDYAALLADAGADALELNLYLMAADLDDTAASVEQRIVEVVRRVVQSTDIPVAVKLSPYFTALPELLLRVEDAGALGVVLFNRFYQPDIDLDALEVSPTLDLSTSADLRLPLRWTAVVRRQLAMSIAVSSGVHSGSDVVKALMVGADVAMTTSALLRHGPDHLRTMLDDLAVWLTERDYESTDELRGSMAQHHVGDPDAYERANYVRVLQWGTRRYR